MLYVYQISNSKQAYVFVAHVNLNKHMSADQLTIAGLDLRFEEVGMLFGTF